MAAPTTAFPAANAHLAAVPWTRKVTVATGKMQWVPFLNVARSLQVRTDQTADVYVAFGPGAQAADNAATEFPVSDVAPYSEQVHLVGVWLVNRASGSAVFWLHAQLTPDAAAAWPVYSAANGYDGTDETPAALPDAVTLS